MYSFDFILEVLRRLQYFCCKKSGNRKVPYKRVLWKSEKGTCMPQHLTNEPANGVQLSLQEMNSFAEEGEQ